MAAFPSEYRLPQSRGEGMKIAQISPFYAPHHGGVESFVRDMAEEMTRRGHDVTVITSLHDRSLPEEESIRNVRVLRVPLRMTVLRTPIPKHLQSYLDADYDIIHTHTPPPSFAYIASRHYGSGPKHVVTYHCDSDIPSRLLSPVIRVLDRRTSARILRSADRVIVTTETYASTSLNTWDIRPEIVPVSANTRRFFPDPEDRIRTRRRLSLDGKRIVLFVGRLVRHKGVHYLIDAMRFLDDGYVLIIAGAGDYAQPLRRAIRVRGLEKRVSMIGDVPDTVLPSLYRAADVLVVPSTSRLEAFGISAVEAMASGTPVIVSDIPGVREIIDDGVQGLRAEPMNPEDIAARIRTVLEDRKRRDAMGKEAVSRAKVFSSGIVAERMLRVYSDILSSDNA